MPAKYGPRRRVEGIAMIKPLKAPTAIARTKVKIIGEEA